MDITPIIEAVITLVIAVVSCLVVPPVRDWLNAKTDATTMTIVNGILAVLVSAAEQTIVEGSVKKEAVKKWFEAELEKLGLSYDADQIDNMIESAVYNLKKKDE